ncbi:MAG: hypothetical protein HYV13_02085 [Candidatus Doudnabacteria bacterium]|nr:hypothetical protein [Candidatus Doudnabacteria bacterium]
MPNKQNPILVANQSDEHRQVRRDLIKVLTLNGILFAILIGLYFWNRSTGTLEQLFAKLLKF